LELFVLSDGGGRSLAARVNGTEVPFVSDAFIPLDNVVHEGSNTAEILFENLGCHRFGPVIEERQGITKISLVPQTARGHSFANWRMVILPDSSPAAELAVVRADFDDRHWRSVRLVEPAAATPAGKNAVYRTSLWVSQDRLNDGVPITFPVIDDRGVLYVNGREAGTADDWSKPWTFEITKYLRAGDNSIALLVHNDRGDGGLLRGCTIDPRGRRLDNVQVTPTTAVADISIDADQIRSLLLHYTMEFELPRTPAVMSAPWKLHVVADANALVTLNGHLLGRYWAVGPQREIWLPEYWLNFGPKAKNVVELQARPTVIAPVGKLIKRVEVRPYEQATNPMSSAQ
jgi:hypothetical protein